MRYEKVQKEIIELIINHRISDEEREKPKFEEIVHSSATSQIAKLLAMKRDQNTELAAITGSIHDIGRIISGKKQNHAENGFEPAKKFLKGMNIFKDEEIELITNAVKNHSKKDKTGNWLNEIIKDADVLAVYIYKGEPKESHINRFNLLSKELGINNVGDKK